MPVQSEVQKTNKILTDIFKVLAAGQTPADIKASANAKKEADDRIKKAPKPKPKPPKPKKGTEEKVLGLFATIKNDVTEWALKAKINQITWGNLGKTIKESVKNWFKKVSETNTLLGRTFRVAAALWNNVFKKIGQNFKKVFDAVTSQVREVLGPVAALYDVMISALKGVWDTTKAVFGSFFQFFKKVPPEDKRRNKLLRGMLHEMIRARKGKFVEGLGDKKKGGLFGKMGGLLGKLGPALLFVGKLVLVIFSIYNLVKGFIDSDADTIAGRVKEAIFGLFKLVFEYPLRFLEWVLKKMGFAADGMTEKVLGWIQTWIDFAVDFNPLRPFLDFLDGFLGTKGTFWEKVKAGFGTMVDGAIRVIQKWGPILAKAISPIIEGLATFFKGFWNSMVNWIIGVLADLPFTEGVRDWLAGTTFNVATPGAGASISDEDAKRWQGNAANRALANAPLKEIKDLMAEANARMALGQEASVAALVQTAREAGGYKTEVNVPSDEVEGSLLFGNADQEYVGG